jgi:4-amino-4-deoxy-L-arabinose transferase-like glycosyltransferase
MWLCFSVVTVEALFSVPLLTWERATGGRYRHFGLALSLLMTACVVLFVRRRLPFLVNTAQELGRHVSRIPTAQWILLCFTAGIVLRTLWFLLFSTPIEDDPLDYYRLAVNLMQRGAYAMGPNGSSSFLPPGLPLVLAASFKVFGIHTWSVFAMNALLFGVTLMLVDRLAARIGNRASARLSVLLVGIWPAYAAWAALPNKSEVLIPLLALALLAYARAGLPGPTMRDPWLWVAVAGVAVGYASLTQPSMLLLPVVFLSFEWVRNERAWPAIQRVGTVGIAMALVVLPWTVRNYSVLHQWVLVSSNGASVFYRANNPLATGGYTPQGAAGRGQEHGYKLGMEWIAANPGRFLRLALRKQVLFLGEDTYGVLASVRSDEGKHSVRFVAAKGICQLFWGFLWLVLLAVIWSASRRTRLRTPQAALLMLPCIYLYLIHSVLESDDRFHEPLLAILAVLGGLLVCGPGMSPISEVPCGGPGAAPTDVRCCQEGGEELRGP